MKIDKIVFCCSEYYAPFWNIQSQIWKTKFGVDPVCLLFANRMNCSLSEKYGQVIECAFDRSLPDIIQLQFKKFFHPTTEPDKTWMIGDIDQIPLQTEHFLNNLEAVRDDAYCHFNYTLCGQMRNLPGEVYLKRGAYVNGGFDLPGHYHCAKGYHYQHLYFKNRPFREVVAEIVASKRYGMVQEDAQRNLTKQIHGSFWVAEEMYTSEHLWYGFKKGTVPELYLKEYHIFDQKIDRVGKMGGQWSGTDYVYDAEKLKNRGYVDIHCMRPYHIQEKPMMKILEIAGMV